MRTATEPPEHLYFKNKNESASIFLLACGFILIPADGFGSRLTHPPTRRRLWPWFLFCLIIKRQPLLMINPDGCMRCKPIFIYKLFEEDVFVGYLTPSPVINIDKLAASISVTWTHHRSHAAAILTAVSHTELNKEKADRMIKYWFPSEQLHGPEEKCCPLQLSGAV